MTGNVSMNGTTAVFYLPMGGAKLGVLDTQRHELEVLTVSHGRKLRARISLHDMVQAADPQGTTWQRVNGVGL